MTEEIKEEVVEESTEPTKEELAYEKGWRPETEYTGDPDAWVDADEFLKREPLFKSIHKLSRENKELRNALVEVKNLFKNVQQTSKAQAMAELKTQFEHAAAEGNVKGAIEVRDKMRDLEVAPVVQNEEVDKKTSTFNSWVEANPWYESDKTLRRQANGIGSELVAERCQELGIDASALSATDLHAIYIEVSKQIKEEFPDKFSNPNRRRAAAVSESTRRTTTDKTNSSNKKVYGIRDLPDEDAIAVARNLIRHGVFKDEKEYMEAYIAGAGTLKTE